MASEFTTYKLIVLFMLEHAETELTNSQISEFVLSNARTNYFEFQQAMSELEEAELISKKRISNSSYYQITEDGQTTLSYFGKELPKDIQSDILEYLTTSGFNRPMYQIRTPASYYQTDQGTYEIRCQILDSHASFLDLTLSAPSLDAAKGMCEKWPLKAQDIYKLIVEGLL